MSNTFNHRIVMLRRTYSNWLKLVNLLAANNQGDFFSALVKCHKHILGYTEIKHSDLMLLVT